jgi:hypothetical protein
MYNTTSMLRTMELILGLRPMTHFDAGARPMFTAFQADPDARPYTAEKPKIPLDRRNPDASPAAEWHGPRAAEWHGLQAVSSPRSHFNR